jgi:hypothetical protein
MRLYSRDYPLITTGCILGGLTMSDDRLKRTLQIATIGPAPETVLMGIRNSLIHKLALIATKENQEVAQRTKINIERTLNVPVDIHLVSDMVLEGILDTTVEILEMKGPAYEDIIVNVAGGEKILTCSMISPAFIQGLKAFHVVDDETVMLPVLKLS